MRSVLLLLGIGVLLANCEVGMVDDQQFNSMKTVPMAEWMRQNEEVYHLETHVIFKSNIQVAKERFNQSTDDVLSDAPADKPDSLHIDDEVLSDAPGDKHDSLGIDDKVRRNTDDMIAAENRLRTYTLCTPSRRHEHR